MNICFVANFYKTYFFHEIAKALESQGVRVHWIVVNRRLRDFLLRHYPADRILLVNKDNASISAEPVGEFRLNELIYGDRILRYEPAWAKDYLRNIQRPFMDFVSAHNIRFIFGEVTWAHEILFHRIVSHHSVLGARYLCPHTIRIPAGRFAFFSDEYQSELYECAASDKADDANIDFTVTKPDYLAINDRRLRAARSLGARIARLRRYFTRENIDPTDPCVTANRWTSFKLRAAEELNRELYRLVPKRKFDQTLSSRPYVFVALHKQPEASIDVIGRYYEDQYRNIVNIWRSLPDGWLLLVKEHTNAVGDRSPLFYRNIARHENVILVDETSDSYELIKNSRAVISVSGTVAYEAALLNRKSFTFAKTFFNRFDSCSRLSMDVFTRGDLFSDGSISPTPYLEPVKQYILLNSFKGVVSDPDSNPTCLVSENIEVVAAAFLRVILDLR